MAAVPAPNIRLRAASIDLLALPWDRPLAAWPADAARFRELAVGVSRHVVRFVECGGQTYALKELPLEPARREYRILRELEARAFPSARPFGLVEREERDEAILVTEYIERSFQFRRLFERLPSSARAHRERLLDALAGLLVDLHRAGVFWGDASLANALFRRDGQLLQALLVDAETSEAHPGLTDGQRAFDVEILVENVAGDLIDLGTSLGLAQELVDEEIEAARSLADRYHQLWGELHDDLLIGRDERYLVEARIRRLNELGFAVDELVLEPAGDRLRLQLQVAVTSRHFHAQALRRLTSLDVGEGQATILLNDLRAYQGRLQAQSDHPIAEEEAAERWVREVARPAMARLAALPEASSDLVQAYCDLLEVRWLLSERAGHDVGDDVALDALATRAAPPDSAAGMALAESPTQSFDVRDWLPEEAG